MKTLKTLLLGYIIYNLILCAAVADEQLSLQNETVSSGQSLNYTADITITVGPDYTIQSGATVNMAAGESTTISSGFHAESGSNLIITSLPRILTQPTGQTIKQGDDFTFAIALQSSANQYTYQWQKEKSGAWLNIPGAESCEYAINTAQPERTGTYRCMISNRIGPIVFSNNAVLKVMPFSNGTFYANPELGVKDAIALAVNGNIIELEDGSYTGADNINLDFNGKAITIKSPNGPANCIIDCNQQGRGFIFHNNEGSNSKIIGITIREGKSINIPGTDYSSEGGGIFIYQDCAPEIINCIIADNGYDTSAGGGIYCGENSAPLIKDCRILGNGSLQEISAGGGIYCDRGSSPRIIDCYIRENQANRGSAGGGGIFIGVGATPTLDACEFISNYTTGNGAAIRCSSGADDLLFSNLLMSGNFSTYRGGGIYANEGSYSSPGNRKLELSKCTMRNNYAMLGGACYFESNINPRLSNCIINRNQASTKGGAVYCDYGTTAQIINCTICRNKSASFPGIFCNPNSGQGPNSLTMMNTILWENIIIAQDNTETYCGDGECSELNTPLSLIANNHIETVNSGSPLFAGYLYQTTYLLDFRLQHDSPCIDRGASGPLIPTTDINGNARPFDGNTSGMALNDIGAFEYTASNMMITQQPNSEGDISVSGGSTVNMVVKVTSEGSSYYDFGFTWQQYNQTQWEDVELGERKTARVTFSQPTSTATGTLTIQFAREEDTSRYRCVIRNISENPDIYGSITSDEVSLTVIKLKQWYPDEDGDGYGNNDWPTWAAEQPDGHVALGNDCNDQDPTIHPDALEICDHIDQDCDGELNCYIAGDSDIDGIQDQDEINIYGTDPQIADTDNDGIIDGDELAWMEQNWNNNPDRRWNGDFDNDGIINLLDPDSDGDSFLDGIEIQKGFDPLFYDGEDADGDFATNDFERAQGTDPLDEESTPGYKIIYNYDKVGRITSVEVE